MEKIQTIHYCSRMCWLGFQTFPCPLDRTVGWQTNPGSRLVARCASESSAGEGHGDFLVSRQPRRFGRNPGSTFVPTTLLVMSKTFKAWMIKSLISPLTTTAVQRTTTTGAQRDSTGGPTYSLLKNIWLTIQNCYNLLLHCNK